jgi:phosphatidylglycerophosphate synthase
MSARAVHLVIDARPRGPHGLLAVEEVLGKSVLGRLFDLATENVPAREPIVVHARAEEHDMLRALTADASHTDVVFVNGPPRADATVLRTDRLYDPVRLKRSLRRGHSPESAVVWSLDRPESLSTAEQELARRLTYQPLGKYWAFPLAERLADRLCPTSVRPNAVTIASGVLMIAAAVLVAAGVGELFGRSVVALFLAAALVLDTADGRLARLQGTCSAFGQWLDQVVDELVDLALHAAIAWAAFRSHGSPIWLVVGIIYASGKYLFLVQSLLGNELEKGDKRPTTLAAAEGLGTESGQGNQTVDRIAGVVRLLGHADLRWHLWIVLALVGRLDVALAAYAGYFVLRSLAGVIRKGVRYA